MKRAAWVFLLLGGHAAAHSDSPKPWLGCWETAGGAKPCLVRFESRKCFLFEDGRLQIFAARYERDKVVLRSLGRTMTWSVQLAGTTLTLAAPDGKMELRFRKLAQVPAELELRPLALGKAGDLPESQVRKVREELARRLVEDQAVRKEPARFKDMPHVDAGNTAFLTRLVRDLGWVDARRFGPEAANAAFLIAQHSGDLPLMLAALPAIEEDVKARRFDAQYYALLYDRLQLLMGEKQKYGTQLGRDDRGAMVILPVVDRNQLETFRRELGLMPFTQYLEMFMKNNGLREVPFAEE
jgi:hypothetical protein